MRRRDLLAGIAGTAAAPIARYFGTSAFASFLPMRRRASPIPFCKRRAHSTLP
jgi:hypothetical protein